MYDEVFDVRLEMLVEEISEIDPFHNPDDGPLQCFFCACLKPRNANARHNPECIWQNARDIMRRRALS